MGIILLLDSRLATKPINGMHSPGFATEFEGGHGSHTAGTAAGAILESPSELECGDGEELSCFGGCFESMVLDDAATNTEFNVQTFCPAFDCDGLGDGHLLCFDDAVETLTTNGGVAQGAKISVFDVISDDSLLVYASVAGNGLWDAVENTGCKVHSNSWGSTGSTCETDVFTTAYDGYMYEVGFEHASMQSADLPLYVYCGAIASCAQPLTQTAMLQGCTVESHLLRGVFLVSQAPPPPPTVRPVPS